MWIKSYLSYWKIRKVILFLYVKVLVYLIWEHISCRLWDFLNYEHGFFGKMYTMILWDKIRGQKMEVIFNYKKNEELWIEQLVMYLLDRNEGPSWIPRNHIKIQGIVVCIYSPNNSDAQIPEAPWSPYLVSPRTMRYAVSKINVNSDWSLTPGNSLAFILTHSVLLHSFTCGFIEMCSHTERWFKY